MIQTSSPSTTMFMDLAFLLVSMLLLLAREPDDDEALPLARIRIATEQHSAIVEDKSLPGQSVRFFIAKNGRVSVKAAGMESSVQCDEAGITHVIERVATPRTVILEIDKEAPYMAVAMVREQFESVKAKGGIHEVLETVRRDSKGGADVAND